MQYNRQGELWYVTRRHWEAGDQYCEQQVIDQILEVRGSGRARYVARERDPAAFDWIVPDTAVWSDYDGDTIYGDYTAEWVEVQPDVWELEVEDRTAYLPGIGQMDNATGEVMYTHGDQVGSLRAVTRCTVGAQECIPGETATVLQRPVYTAFGELVYDLAPQDTFIRYRYAGDWGYEGRLGSESNGGSDSALGLPYTHVGHRWYDPSTGRFLQRDPIGINGGINVYAYASSNPLQAVDPSGLEIYVNTGYPPVSPYTGGAVVTNRPAAVPPDQAPPPATTQASCADYLHRIEVSIEGSLGYQPFGTGVKLTVKDTVLIYIRPGETRQQAIDRAIAAMKADQQQCLQPSPTPPPSAPRSRSRHSREYMWGCFLAGTAIAVPGSCACIEDLRVGSEVISYDPHTDRSSTSIVTHTIVGETCALVHIALRQDDLLSTPDHPFWVVGKGWTPARDLRPADLLLDIAGCELPILAVRVEALSQPLHVFNITVVEPSTFFVGDAQVLAHNKPR